MLRTDTRPGSAGRNAIDRESPPAITAWSDVVCGTKSVTTLDARYRK
jgi:hypothetical protein